MDQNAVLVRYLRRVANENATGPIDHMRFDTGGDQPHDLFLQRLPVAIVRFVPDHQIDRESFEAPVGMGLHELAHKVDVGCLGDLQQHDGQIAGDCIAPQA